MLRARTAPHLGQESSGSWVLALRELDAVKVACGVNVRVPEHTHISPLTSAMSPLPGIAEVIVETEPGEWSKAQLVEQRLGLFQIGGVEAFGEPIVDPG